MYTYSFSDSFNEKQTSFTLSNHFYHNYINTYIQYLVHVTTHMANSIIYHPTLHETIPTCNVIWSDMIPHRKPRTCYVPTGLSELQHYTCAQSQQKKVTTTTASTTAATVAIGQWNKLYYSSRFRF